MKTSEAINGFIADDPRLTYSQDGTPRFYARIGIPHYEATGDGRFRRLDNTYHDLIQFGLAAELSYERFSRGDEFIAQGQTRQYTREVEGQSRTDEQFLARRIGHDPNTTIYVVDRRPRAEREAATQQATERQEIEQQATAEAPTAHTAQQAQQYPAPQAQTPASQHAAVPPPPEQTASQLGQAAPVTTQQAPVGEPIAH